MVIYLKNILVVKYFHDLSIMYFVHLLLLVIGLSYNPWGLVKLMTYLFVYFEYSVHLLLLVIGLSPISYGDYFI